VVLETNDTETEVLIAPYVALHNMPTNDLRITTERRTFERWLGRRVSSPTGSAYAFSTTERAHIVLINLPRVHRSRPLSLEIVVAEELIHMRDRLDGDLRRHVKFGYDRIADRVAAITGASLDKIRVCLVPVKRRPLRCLYLCPKCQKTVRRRRRGL
jgi:hypothetical protein